ncbi:MAG: isopenicillin N synthase family dioxygenase [Gammaproteobacteria bacterium]
MNAHPDKPVTAAAPTIPVLDVGGYLRGIPGELDRLAGELRFALEHIGFFFTINHGVPADLITRTFAETARFHALPKSEKQKVAINAAHVGFMDNEGELPRTSPYYTGTLKPDVGEAFFIKRERAPEPLAARNQWPDGLPGFRETLVEYFEASEGFFRRMLPVFAVALELPRDYFQAAFGRYQALSVLRVAHFPPDPLEADQFNVGPHTDSSFATLLATTQVPGLELLDRDGRWFPAPPIPGSILFNSGDMLTRWTNGRFLSTPHRVINRSGRDRYSIPLFVHPNPDFEIACLPTCTGLDNPPRHPPITSGAYLEWFMAENFKHAAQPRLAN